MPPEQHYDINKLHKYFAIAALVLLLGLGAIFSKDYNREWKKYQKQFRDLEVEKARVRHHLLGKALEDNAEYQQVLKDLDAAEADVQAKNDEIEAIQDEITELETRQKIITQQMQFNKAEYDAVKYEYEAARAHDEGNIKGLHNRVAALGLKNDEYRVQVELLDSQIDEKNQRIKELTAEYDVLVKQKNRMEMQYNLTVKKLQRMDPENMSFANTIAEVVRNAPIIELANPSYKVKQIVLKDITDDVNITQVPKVDRCITCHVGIADPEYKDAPQPLRAHPNLELYVGNDSVHAMAEFACTTCHMGRGRATKFIDAAHTPRDEEQRKEWEEEYGWEPLHHWNKPMYPLPYTEAGCFKCHSDQSVVKGAEKLNLGLHLIEQAGCYGCHNIERYTDWGKPGPSLVHVADKLDKSWAFRWIKEPTSFRPNTWMPSFYQLHNNSSEEALVRGDQEILAMVHYLFAASTPFKPDQIKFSGDKAKGEELVKSLGCMACHKVTNEKIESGHTRDELRREHGPALTGLGSKTSKAWIYSWIKNPKRYHPETVMPDFRLSDEEAADIAVYLAGDKAEEFEKLPVPSVDTELLNGIVLDFLMKNYTVAQATEQIQSMTDDQKLHFAGEKLIRHYGCFACHEIKGFENEKPIGPELTYHGDTDPHRLDFGFVHIDHTRQAFYKQKLLQPRIFDEGKVVKPLTRLRMPNFYLSEENAEAITTALLGFTKERPSPSKMPARTPEHMFIVEGQEVIRQFNCQGCHVIEGEGGSIKPLIQDWLVAFEEKGKTEAETITDSFSPPNLLGIGAKFQADWLFEFLHQPDIVRPWLTVRMPTYHFGEKDINALVKYFNALDQATFPFSSVHEIALTKEEFNAAEKLFSIDYFNCASCHVVGDRYPSGTQDSWAPNLALARDRLRPDWMIRWIKNPPALMPGTKMPVFYDPEFYESSGPEDLLGGDENEQIRVLRDYLLTLADKPQGKAAQKSAPASTENSGEATVESPTPQPPASDLPATP